MSITFYYSPMTSSNITHAVLAELGLEYEGVALDIEAGDTQRADFLKLNPNGRVPTLIHDGAILWESAAINLYLGETFGVEKGLFPTPGPLRGQAMKWIIWGNVTLGEAAGRLSSALPPGAEGAVQEGSVDFAAAQASGAEDHARASADLNQCFGIIEAALAEAPYVLGDYSLVDTHLQVFVGWVGMMGFNIAPFPKTLQWLERVSARPAIKALLESQS